MQEEVAAPSADACVPVTASVAVSYAKREMASLGTEKTHLKGAGVQLSPS